MKQKRYSEGIGEYIVAGATATFGVVLFVESYSISISAAAAKANIITSEFFPRIIAGGLIVLSLITLVTAIVKRGREARSDAHDSVAVNNPVEQLVFAPSLGVVISLGLLGLFFLVFKPLGFVLSALIYLTTYLFVFGRTKPWRSLLYSVIYVAAVFVTFRFVFRVMAPSGIFF